jgi:predicted component of type VI protein secretion system
MATSLRPFRLTKSGAAAQLVIALPAEVDAATLSGLGESVSKALQAVAKEGSQQLLARAAAVAVAAVQIAAPPIELIEERIAQRRTMKRIVEETQWYSADQIRQQLGKRVAPTVDWKRRGKIFGVPIDDREFFPAWQFGVDLKPLPVVAQVLKALGPIADPWKIAAWFHFANPRLAKRVGTKMVNRAPKNCLDDRKRLIEAARQRHTSFVA